MAPALEPNVFRTLLALGVVGVGATVVICFMAVSDYRGWRYLRGERRATDVELGLLDAVRSLRDTNVALLEELRAGNVRSDRGGAGTSDPGAPSLSLGNG